MESKLLPNFYIWFFKSRTGKYVTTSEYFDLAYVNLKGEFNNELANSTHKEIISESLRVETNFMQNIKTNREFKNEYQQTNAAIRIGF